MVAAEVGVGSAIEEDHRAAQELSGIGEHEQHPLGDMGGVSESPDGDGEPVDGLGFFWGGELLLQQGGHDRSGRQRVEPDAVPGPLCGDGLAAHPASDCEFGGRIGHGGRCAAEPSHCPDGLGRVAGHQRAHGTARNHRDGGRRIARYHHHFRVPCGSQSGLPCPQQVDDAVVIGLHDQPRPVIAGGGSNAGGQHRAVEAVSSGVEHCGGCVATTMRGRQVGGHLRVA